MSLILCRLSNVVYQISTLLSLITKEEIRKNTKFNQAPLLIPSY